MVRQRSCMNSIPAVTPLIITLAFASIPIPAAFGRLSEAWTFEALSEKADLIAIISVVGEDPAPDTFRTDQPGRFIGINTRFQVLGLLKGKLATKELTVLHFFEEDGITNGPISADFQYTRTYEAQTFKDGKAYGRAKSGPSPQKPKWIAFLKARSDGRFEPVTGQYDSADSFYEVIDTFGIR
jgi:hypothetical protein